MEVKPQTSLVHNSDDDRATHFLGLLGRETEPANKIGTEARAIAERLECGYCTPCFKKGSHQTFGNKFLKS